VPPPATRRTATRRPPRHLRALNTKPARSVLLWLDKPDAYLRAADAAGLTRQFSIDLAPLASEPPDEILGRADALLAWRPPVRLAARAPRLTWIQSLTGGIDQWLVPDYPERAVLTCARGSHRLSMPEHILAGLFLIAKSLAPIVLDQRERRWTRRVNPTLAGRTLAILGLGAIGAELARKAAALEMRVIGTKRDGAAVPHVERVYRPPETDAVLGEADYVVLLLPSTPETRGLIDARSLKRMKRTAYLLNFGRGDLVVEADLATAVRASVIAGAVLDVFVKEPLPAESPLWTTEGITIFPHVGGLHPDRDDTVAALWVDNLRRFADGRPLREVVDRPRGY
jgi:phosphoglycerate dehydrogenase-like enzyme